MHKNNIIEVKIESQGFLGDGIGHYNNKKVLIPFSIKGDLIRAKIIKENSKLIQAEILEIIEPSSYREKAFCEYYTICGGCNLQHLSQEYYINYKKEQATSILNRCNVKINIDDIEYVDIPFKSRRRARFHAKNNKIGFFKSNSNEIIEIKKCDLLNDNIISQLSTIRNNNKIKDEDVNITVTDNNYINISEYKILFNDYFLQASCITNEIVAKFIEESVDQNTKIIDLFSGASIFGFLLHKKIKFIKSIEGDEKVILPVQKAIQEYNIQNIEFEQRDLFKSPLKHQEISKFDQVIINPPKNGAEPQFIEIAKSKNKIVHILSCNPITLERDLKILLNSNYYVEKIAIIDQFKYSHNSEIYIRCILI